MQILVTMQVLVLSLLAVFISDSHQQCFGKNDVTEQSDATEFDWKRSRQEFSMNLLKVLPTIYNYENVVFSPWSIQEALLLAYFGAANETEESLAKVLQIPAKQSKAYTWRLFYTAKKTQVSKELTMKSANKIFLSNKLHPRLCMQEKFGNELELIDYQTDGGKWAEKHINTWVESVTEGLIKDVIEDVTPETTANLVNAVYFKGYWMDKFSPDQTKDIEFHENLEYSRSIKMMVKEAVFKHGYSKMLDTRMLMLPYQGNTTSMIILLPEDLETMIYNINVATFPYFTAEKNYKSDYIRVILPKFQHRSNLNLNLALKRLGIGEALTVNAHYPGFTGSEEVFIESATHEAVIKVDEEGTEAAAVTDMGPALSAPIVSEEFRCDRPFAYIIYDFKDQKTLFMGTFRHPVPEENK